jgi:hypothetical protein
VSSVLPDGSVDLTRQGALDWVHWGYRYEGAVDRKAGTAQIDTRVLGAQPLHQYTQTSVTYSWSDGTPTTNIDGTRTGIYTLGEGNGFQIMAPADRARRTLTVYLSGFGADFRVGAELSDGSAAAYNEVILHSGVNENLFREYSFTYSAASADQTLKVTWIDFHDLYGGGNVTLESATLN